MYFLFYYFTNFWFIFAQLSCMSYRPILNCEDFHDHLFPPPPPWDLANTFEKGMLHHCLLHNILEEFKDDCISTLHMGCLNGCSPQEIRSWHLFIPVIGNAKYQHFINTGEFRAFCTFYVALFDYKFGDCLLSWSSESSVFQFAN